jgi:hypothetical protein
MTEQKTAAPDQEKVNAFRDAAGRFNKGNPGGPGNPFARFSAQMRKAFAEEASPDDFREVARALIDKAKEGDVAAAKLVLSYTLGKPLAGVDPDRLDEQECAQWQRENVPVQEAFELTGGMNATMLCLFLRGVIPILSQMNWQTLADALKGPTEVEQQQEPVEEEKPPSPATRPEPQPKAAESDLAQARRQAAQIAQALLGEGQFLPIPSIADDKRSSGIGRAANPPCPQRDKGTPTRSGGPPAPG